MKISSIAVALQETKKNQKKENFDLNFCFEFAIEPLFILDCSMHYKFSNFWISENSFWKSAVIFQIIKHIFKKKMIFLRISFYYEKK